MGAFAMLNVKSLELCKPSKSSTNNEIENEMKEKIAIIHVKNVTGFVDRWDDKNHDASNGLK